MLDGIHARFGAVPVVLIGHWMGARAALRVAGHPVVIAVAGLAPWLPPGEMTGQLAGRRVLLAHGSADVVTSPGDTWAYAERARAVCDLTAIEVRRGDHPMLRRVRLWHAIAARVHPRIVRHLHEHGYDAAAAAVAAASREPGAITLV